MNQSVDRWRLRAGSCLLVGVLRFASVSSAEDAMPYQAVEGLMLLAGAPGLQVAVVKDDKVVWRHSYGDAVLATPGPRTQRHGRKSAESLTCQDLPGLGCQVTRVRVV